MNLFGLARHGLNGFEQIAILAVVVTAIISLIYAWLLRGLVMKKRQRYSGDAKSLGCDPYWSGQLSEPAVKNNLACNRITRHSFIFQRLHCSTNPGICPGISD